jgi:hypothetical protein
MAPSFPTKPHLQISTTTIFPFLACILIFITHCFIFLIVVPVAGVLPTKVESPPTSFHSHQSIKKFLVSWHHSRHLEWTKKCQKSLSWWTLHSRVARDVMSVEDQFLLIRERWEMKMNLASKGVCM